MALHKTEQFFANLVKDYLDKTTDKAVKDHVVCNRGGLQMLEPSMKALFDESAAAYKAEQLAALEREMARVQRNCATGKRNWKPSLPGGLCWPKTAIISRKLTRKRWESRWTRQPQN